MTPDSPSATGVISGSRSLLVLASSGIAALSTLVVTVVSSRSLSVTDNAHFLVYWSLLFGVFQISIGLQNEATRASAAAGAALPDAPPDGRPKGRVFLMPLVLTGAVAVVVLALAPWWTVHVLAGTGILVVLISVLVIVGYGCHLTLTGALAGRRQFGYMAGVNAAEALVRLAAAITVGVLVGRLVPLQIAVTLPALMWVLLTVFSPHLRSAAASLSDVSLRRLLANGALSMVSSAAAAVLINAFPAIVKLVLGGAVTAGSAVALMLSIQITRAPLMMPLVSFQGVAISAFTRQRTPKVSALFKPMLVIVGIGVVLAGLVAWLGPWVVGLLFGAQYVLPREVLAGLAFAAVSVGLLTLTGTATIAVSAHRAYTAGWIVGAVVTVGLLFVPVAPAARVVLAELIGPLAGCVIHVSAIRRASALPRLDPGSDLRPSGLS